MLDFMHIYMPIKLGRFTDGFVCSSWNAEFYHQADFYVHKYQAINDTFEQSENAFFYYKYWYVFILKL